jgi:hypothetical protein
MIFKTGTFSFASRLAYLFNFFRKNNGYLNGLAVNATEQSAHNTNARRQANC